MKNLFLAIAVIMTVFMACSTEDAENVPQMKKQSRYISKAEAQKQVMSILGATGSATRTNALYGGKPITSSFTYEYNYYLNGIEQTCDMYIFNFGNNEGYAAVISDSKTEQLYAITDYGKLEENSSELESLIIPINYEWEPDTIDHIEDSILSPQIGDWEDTFYSYNPGIGWGLCKVTWGYGYPYNYYCHTTSGQNAVTGCVATALAQMMSCYKYPTYYSGYSFDWNEMTLNYRYVSGLDLTPFYSIARIMEILGRPGNLSVDYGIDNSSAVLEDAPQTLENLGYVDGGDVSTYNLSTILSEICDGYPVVLGGTNIPRESDNPEIYKGHAWLVDGILKRTRELQYYENGVYSYSEYETAYYLHCNWGREGVNDGFYANKVFNPYENPAFNHLGVPVNNPTALYKYNLKMLTSVRKQ